MWLQMNVKTNKKWTKFSCRQTIIYIGVALRLDLKIKEDTMRYHTTLNEEKRK